MIHPKKKNLNFKHLEDSIILIIIFLIQIALFTLKNLF